MYVKVINGDIDVYPYSEGQLRRDNPKVSFPRRMSDAMLQDWGVYSVTVADKPTYTDRTQKVSQDATPSLVNNVWVLGWSVSDKTSEDIAKYDNTKELENRMRRDKKLTETDWWASSDLTMTAEQTAYRQALRDITAHANWPHLSESDWPVKP